MTISLPDWREGGWMAGIAAIIGVAAMVARFGASSQLVLFVPLALVLATVSWVDILERRIPNFIVVPAAAAVLPLVALIALSSDGEGSVSRAALAGLATFTGLLVLNMVAPQRLGMGDVKLGLLLGLCLGWLGWLVLAGALFLGFAAVAVYGLLMILLRRLRAGKALPLAPFLSAASITAVALI